MKSTEDQHVECISDFCGNMKSPGHWADMFKRPDGSTYIGLGGGWEFYHPTTPDFIEENDPRFADFIAACEMGDEIEFIRKNY